MPTLTSRSSRFILVLLVAATAQAQDLHIKKSISVGGNVVSSTDTSIKGARERTVTQSPTGNTVTIRQCDLKQTITLNEQAQTYLITKDAQDDAAIKAAAMLTGAPEPASAGSITESAAITDTGERKTIDGYPARHLKIKVTTESSKNACTQVSQAYDVDGWYTDAAKEMPAACQQFLPPVRQGEGCSDRIIRKRTGTGKPGYPLSETLTVHGADGSTTQIASKVTEITKPTLTQDLFDVPAGYREVKTLAELNAAGPAPQVAKQPAPTPAPMNSATNQQQLAQSKLPKPPNPLTAALHPGAAMAANQQAMAMAQQQMAMGNGAMAQMGQMGQMGQMRPDSFAAGGGMPGQAKPGTPAAASVPAPVGPKPAGKIRIGVAPPDAQVGQGNNTGADYSTPIRNAEITLMSGPAVDIVPLDAHISMQLQAEAQQKQCDFVMFSSVVLKRTQSTFGKWSKFGSMAANVTPVGMMAHGAASVAAAQAANVAASQMAQQQAISQLAAFNGQVKSKDDVTVKYQLVPTGQNTPTLDGTLQGKAKSDGEDVLTPMLTQTANAVLTQVSLSMQAAQAK